MRKDSIRQLAPMGPGLIMGYDWERYGRHSDESQNEIERDWSATGVDSIMRVHEEYDAPLTFFVLTKILSVPRLRSRLERVQDHRLVEIAQHSHSHQLVRPLGSSGQAPISVSDFLDDVAHAGELLKQITGRSPIGFRAPLGYHQGFQPQPDVVRGLASIGIEYVSSDARNENDEFPAPWRSLSGSYRQPYIYSESGLLEIPIQGWSDNVLKGMSRHTPLPDAGLDVEREHHAENLTYAVQHGLLYAPAYHPWSIGAKDPNASVIRWLLGFCRKENIPIYSYGDIFALTAS